MSSDFWSIIHPIILG